MLTVQAVQNRKQRSEKRIYKWRKTERHVKKHVNYLRRKINI